MAIYNLVVTVFMLQIKVNPGYVAKDRLVVKRQACTTFPYYDIKCHNICPGYNTSDWVKNSNYFECTEVTPYHCATDDLTGAPVNACIAAKTCNKGEQPFIIFPRGIADVTCKPCKNVDEAFNSKQRNSDTFSRCNERRRTCRAVHGEIECEKPTEEQKYYTQTKCTCIWQEQYIPEFTDTDYCSAVVRCIPYPCDDTADGKKQERLHDFTCGPVCEEGYVRTDNLAECMPFEREDNETTATTPTTAVQKVETKTTLPTSKPTQQSSTVKHPEDVKVKGSGDIIIIVILTVACFVVVVIGIVYIRCRKRNGNISNTNTTEHISNGSNSRSRGSCVHCCNFYLNNTCCPTANNDGGYEMSNTSPPRSETEEQRGEGASNENNQTHSLTSQPGNQNRSNETSFSVEGNVSQGGHEMSNTSPPRSEAEEQGENLLDSSGNPNQSEGASNENNQTHSSTSQLGNQNRSNETSFSVEGGYEMSNISPPRSETEEQRESLLDPSGNPNQKKRGELADKIKEYPSLCETDIARSALRKMKSRLDKDMITPEVITILGEKEVFGQVDLRDVEEMDSTSKRNEKIFYLMINKYVPKKGRYRLFKECLDESDQGALVDKLEEKEDEVIEKRLKEEADSQTLVDAIDHESEGEAAESQ